jgi:hypothetical protein
MAAARATFYPTDPATRAAAQRLLDGSARLATLQADDQYVIDPMNTGYLMLGPLATLAHAGWAVDDVRAYEQDWPGIYLGDLGAMMLRALAALVHYGNLGPDRARAWLRCMFTPRQDKPHYAELTEFFHYAHRHEMGRDENGQPRFGKVHEPYPGAWVLDDIQALTAACPDHLDGVMAALAAGLYLPEILELAEGGRIPIDRMHVLASLRF